MWNNFLGFEAIDFQMRNWIAEPFEGEDKRWVKWRWQWKEKWLVVFGMEDVTRPTEGFGELHSLSQVQLQRILVIKTLVTKETGI